MADQYEDSQEVHPKLTADQLELILRQLESLPTFPAVVAGVLKLLDLPTDAAAQAAELISCDFSLSARVVSMARRRGLEVRGADAAASALGAEALRAAALTVKLFAPPAAGGEEGLDRLGFWQHCLAVAEATRAIAGDLALDADPAEAYLCGLLHDLGKGALACCFPKAYARAVEAARACNGNIAQYERLFLGVDHTVAGRRLAELWRLPPSVVSAAWLHRQPPQTLPASLPHRMLVAAVGLADTMARERQIGSSANWTFEQPAAEIARQIGLPRERLLAIGEGLAEHALRPCRRLGLLEGDGQAACQAVIAAGRDEIGRLYEQLQSRSARQAAQARALDRMAELARSLGPSAGVADVLLEVAKTASAVHGGTAVQRPVVAYSLAETGEILALRWSPSGPPSCRTAVKAPQADPACPPPSPSPADQALRTLLGEGNDLGDWLDLCGYRHHALCCAGRWVGGVLHAAPAEASPGGAEGAEAWAGLAAALGLALGIAQDRAKAMLLSEQLAGASAVISEAQQALAEAKTLSAIGELAAGAAHELNNPLAVVSGRAQLMARKAPDEEQRKTWQVVAEQAQRISDIISELMEFASPPAPNPQPLEVRGLLEEAAKAFSSGAHPKLASTRVDIKVGEDTPAVRADRGQLQSVLVELIRNAATAAGQAPQVALSARAGQPGRTVLLTVADNGPGMDGQTLANAFLPFFSWQAAGRRRGMGLSRAKRYVENSGGRIWIRSKPHEGTTVYVELPQA